MDTKIPAASQPKQKKKISKNKQQDFISAPPVQEIKEPADTDSKSKKKTKYVNLYSQEGKNAQVVLLKGIFFFSLNLLIDFLLYCNCIWLKIYCNVKSD